MPSLAPSHRLHGDTLKGPCHVFFARCPICRRSGDIRLRGNKTAGLLITSSRQRAFLAFFWKKAFSQLKVTAADKQKHQVLSLQAAIIQCLYVWLTKISYWSKNKQSCQHHSTVAKLTIYLHHCCWIKYKSSSERAACPTHCWSYICSSETGCSY